MSTHSTLKNIANTLFSKIGWGRDYAHAPAWYIAAGNPTKSVGLADIGIEYSIDKSRQTFIVAGDSMAPRGISDGDRLTSVSIADPLSSDIPRGTFISIEVDKDYYISQQKQSRFTHKLRCAICKIPARTSFTDTLDKVKEVEPTAYLEEYRQELQRKFNEARAYYGDNEPLLLSVTYKAGTMHYSFHPVRLIRGKIELVERFNHANRQWEKIQPRKLL